MNGWENLWDINITEEKSNFQLDGHSENYINQKILAQLNASRNINLKVGGFTPSSKLQNKLQHMKHGNRTTNYRIGHWNAGGRLWSNKILDLQLLLEEHKPDACYISEANLWEDTPQHMRHIEGYRLIFPKTMITMKHSRLILLIKEDIDFELTEKLMDDENPTIWGRLGRNKKNSIQLGGIYREHRQLGITSPDATRLEIQMQQESRWEKIIRSWSRAGMNSNCVVIGDINLDYLRWMNPEDHLKKMVELTQNRIEIEGFAQLISKHTRTWPGQANSCLDHIWSNCVSRIVSHKNVVNGASDHNYIEVTVAAKEVVTGGFNVRKRCWKKF